MIHACGLLSLINCLAVITGCSGGLQQTVSSLKSDRSYYCLPYIQKVSIAVIVTR